MLKKKIFLTGGAGFIGSAVAKKLVDKGYELTIFDNFSSGLKDNIKDISSKCNVVKGDILDYPSLKKSMQGHDIVIHQAAQLEITTAISSPEKDVDTNIIGSLNILKAMKENNIHKLIIASSACVYGNVNKYPVTEDMTLKPNWEYGVSKLAVEKYCDIFANYENIDIASLRYSIVYGVGEWYGRVLTIFIKRALENKDLVIFEDGGILRDFVNISDVADFNVMLVDREWKGHKIFNVSSGVATSLDEIAKIVQKITKKIDNHNVKVIYESVSEGKFSKYVSGRMRIPRELKVMHLNNANAKKFLNWKPSLELEKGIEQEYLWLKKDPKRWITMSY